MDYVEMKIDGGATCRISQETQEDGISFDDFMQMVEACVVGAGFGQSTFDEWYKGE